MRVIHTTKIQWKFPLLITFGAAAMAGCGGISGELNPKPTPTPDAKLAITSPEVKVTLSQGGHTAELKLDPYAPTTLSVKQNETLEVELISTDNLKWIEPFDLNRDVLTLESAAPTPDTRLRLFYRGQRPGQATLQVPLPCTAPACAGRALVFTVIVASAQ
jgi:hypothetical protein